MGSLSVFHLLFLLIYLLLIVVYWVSLVRILNRAGYSGWWSLLTLVPFVNIYALWRFSKAPWPALDQSRIRDTF